MAIISAQTGKELGAFSEGLAELYLTKRNYEILHRNFSKPWGEIDIIARQGDVLVFVEVKSNARHGHASFSPEVRADHIKLRKVIKSAMLYLEFELKNLECEWRVDIIAVTIDYSREKARISHFKNIGEAIQ